MSETKHTPLEREMLAALQALLQANYPAFYPALEPPTKDDARILALSAIAKAEGE